MSHTSSARAAVLAAVLFAPAASAQEAAPDTPAPPVPPAWSPEARPVFEMGDLIVTGTFAGLSVAGGIASPLPHHAYGGVLFDDGVRSALRLPSSGARYAARDASDVGLSLEATWPFLVDALITAWWYRGNDEVARKMALVDAEAFAIIGGVQGMTNTLVSRERPYARDCGTSIPEKSVDCDGSVRYRSFFSGHSAISFTGASLVCYHHLRLGLLGGPGDAISCATAYAVAGTTATLRVMGDMHYATDVLTGAIAGTIVGLGVPFLRSAPASGVAGPGVSVQIVPVGTGVGVGGSF